MTNGPRKEEGLASAGSDEKKYDWQEAENSYKKALASDMTDTSESCITSENRGYALFKLAMQSKKSTEFLQRIREARTAYREAGLLFKKERLKAESFRCDAKVAYLEFWETSNAPRKKRALQEAWQLAKASLKCFEESGDATGFGETYTELAVSCYLSYFFEPEHKVREQLYRAGLELGERCISFVRDLANPTLLARSYIVTAAFLMVLALDFAETMEPGIKASVDRAKRYWTEARRLDKGATLMDLVGVLGAIDFGEDTGIEGAIKQSEEILHRALLTGDRFMIGLAHDWLAHNIGHKAHISETLQESIDLINDAYQHAIMAEACYRPLNFASTRHGLIWVRSPEAEYYQILSLYQTDPEIRRDLLRKSTDATTAHLRLAKLSGQLDSEKDARHVASKAFFFRSRTETSWDIKVTLLGEALKHRLESIRLTKHLETLHYTMFLDASYLADIKSELAETIQDHDKKNMALEAAVHDKEEAIALLLDDQPFRRMIEEKMEYYWTKDGHMKSELATILTRLYRYNGSKNTLEKAAAAFSNAAQSFRELGQPSRVGDCYWGSAPLWDELENYEKAAEDYREAESNYRKAAEILIPLKGFYQDKASIAETKSRIEEARKQHRIGEYGSAAEYYRKVAELHNLNDKRRYLAASFLALAQLETALDRSRKELSQEALDAFKEASRLFQWSRISVESYTSGFQDSEEAKEAQALIQTSRLREAYCIARTELEEAKMLNMKGDHKTSSERYGWAIHALQKLQIDFESEIDKTETNRIIALARAFQMMARAEAEVSPRLYRTASELFEEAKETLPSETEKRLVLGHSRYCRALETSAKFLDTTRDADYRAAIQRLSIASNYYTTAGFHNASEYTKATRRLLEAHMYIVRANREQDQGKRARIQNTVETLLKTSAELFGEAGYIGKKDQTLKLLESVREEREFTISLDDTLTPRSLASEPNLTHSLLAREDPIGSERFLGPHIVANLFSSSTNLKLGESLGLKMEISNAGMRPARLVRVEKIIPEGFDLVNKPEEVLIDQKHVILKGRRLDPLRTEELNLTLKANVRGLCALKPRILYADEDGKNMLHEPEPLEIVVQDPASAAQPSSSAEASLKSPLMIYLVNSFVEDYMRKRLSLEHAGWRGLPDIVKSLRIPKSQVYGDARYRHTFGKPLERLVKAGIAEFRIFPGSRGRGGNIVKVRLSYEKEPVRRFVDATAMTLPA